MVEEKMIEWPEVFITGNYNLARSRAKACADGLMGWGLCMGGKFLTNKPAHEFIPKKFGEGMVAIGRFLGITPLPEDLKEYAENLKKLA